jgi:malic enzyme
MSFLSWKQERFVHVDIKGVIRNHQSKKDRQYKGQKTKDKRTSNDPHRTTQKLEIDQHEHLNNRVNFWI